MKKIIDLIKLIFGSTFKSNIKNIKNKNNNGIIIQSEGGDININNDNDKKRNFKIDISINKSEFIFEKYTNNYKLNGLESISNIGRIIQEDFDFEIIKFIISNNGDTINNFKIEFEINDSDLELNTFKSIHNGYKTDTMLYNNGEGGIIPFEKVLVCGDKYISNGLEIKPLRLIDKKILIKWRLISDGFSDSGNFEIYVKSNNIEINSYKEYEKYSYFPTINLR